MVAKTRLNVTLIRTLPVLFFIYVFLSVSLARVVVLLFVVVIVVVVVFVVLASPAES
jgi:hypothetical protein